MIAFWSLFLQILKGNTIYFELFYDLDRWNLNLEANSVLGVWLMCRGFFDGKRGGCSGDNLGIFLIFVWRSGVQLISCGVSCAARRCCTRWKDLWTKTMTFCIETCPKPCGRPATPLSSLCSRKGTPPRSTWKGLLQPALSSRHPWPRWWKTCRPRIQTTLGISGT